MKRFFLAAMFFNIMAVSLFAGDKFVVSPEDKKILKIQDKDLYLTASECKITGKGTLMLYKGYTLGYWQHMTNQANWEFDNAVAGSTYEIELYYTIPPRFSGAEYALKCNGETFTGTVKTTESWGQYKIHKVGKLTFDKAGKQKIIITKNNKKGRCLFNLKGVVLRALNEQKTLSDEKNLKITHKSTT